MASEWETRALAAEASLQSLRDKVVPLVTRTKELEKEAKKWRQLAEAGNGGAVVASPAEPVAAGGTMRRNPSQQKKYTFDDGTELTGEQVV